ncbi:hypothetical protein [Streptomyces sp. DASNCL29]|uniref:hypothetical protein n=1 Tax=Streptomyces sp. DASNCL29 TaxID=2583819 RepID=UPI00110FB066|nr:hypothetical protein [Streptomyces sp. DASNCL29]TMU98095.1 hypothetical protein FGK60_09720 [Streptomyces sp. DASNCL29]
MARVYATAADYQGYTGQDPPADVDQLLARATRMLEAQVLRMCWYDVDADGMPTNATVLEAIRRAVCAQVQWWGELGDSIGAAGVGWGSVGIGSVSLSRSGSASGSASAAREIAPQVGDELRSPDLIPEIFRLGAVCW